MIVRVDRRRWDDSSGGDDVTDELEAGTLLMLPALAFDVLADERRFFDAGIATAKNVSFDPATGHVGGIAQPAEPLGAMLRRFSDAAASLVDGLLPFYRGRWQRARSSFRPAEIAGRKTTWRHDDTRLHIDSFPATPVQGKRILRVFTNVNPDGRHRAWRIGEPFEEVARRFADRLRMPLPFTGDLLRLAGITKSRRSPYDALMLQLHDRMKADLTYQAESPQTAVDFPAGCTWIAFTDRVSHAAMAGQFQLEQTFLMPVDAMRNPERSPLRILERIKGRSLL